MPVIGVPVRYDYSKVESKPILYIYESLRLSLQSAGADIFLIVPIQNVNYMTTRNKDFPELREEEKVRINKMLDSCDGLFLPGGMKFTPFDQYILDYAIKKDIPTLGVCLSMQMMSCYQEEVHLEKNETDINHNQKQEDIFCHTVKIDKNSMLYRILEQEEIEVNSFHNYHATKNHLYQITATSPDGLIEALELPEKTFHIGVQWHPERSYSYDTNSKLIIDYFIKEANQYKILKEKRNSIKEKL